MEKIAAIMSFCSNDYRFFDQCINGLRAFASQIIVTVCDHFFDGSPENYSLLEHLYESYPDIEFIEFAYSTTEFYHYTTLFPHDHPLKRHEWHNAGRWMSYFFLRPEITYLYFSDADELADGERLKEWLSTGEFSDYQALRFSCYWYFREACYRAETRDEMSLLLKKDSLDPDFFWNEHERMGLYLQVEGKKRSQVSDSSGIPFVHHYSWVRTQEELLKKFATWGHFWERDWEQLVHNEYKQPFAGTDFIRRYTYQQILPAFDPLKVHIPTLQEHSLEEHLDSIQHYPHVSRVTPQEMFRISIAKHLL